LKCVSILLTLVVGVSSDLKLQSGKFEKQ
jgi:hypothetical protein